MYVVLRTPRLVLRRFTEDDAGDLYALDRDPDVLRFISSAPLPDLESYRALIRANYLPFYARYREAGFWSALEREGGAFIGWFCLHPGSEAGKAAELLQFEDDDLEIGYRLRRAAWGRGYATEVTRSLVTLAFGELEAGRVVGVTSSANRASIRVMEKAGMRRVDGYFPLPWSKFPFVKYALTKEEFDDRKDRAPRAQ